MSLKSRHLWIALSGLSLACSAQTATAQVSVSVDNNVNVPAYFSDYTQGSDMGPGLIGFINSQNNASVRKKIGKLLADGDCQGAARYAYGKGRLELGASIARSCRPAPPPAQPVATASRDVPAQIAPGQIESVLVQIAQNAKTPAELFDETTVSKVEAVGNQLILTALVDRKGAAITESGRSKIVRDVCTASSSILAAGASVRIDFYERGKSAAFDSVVTTRSGCGLGG